MKLAFAIHLEGVAAIVMARKRVKIECPYLGTIRRDLLDFDKLPECSVTLSTFEVYCCLVCGVFLRGKNIQSPAGVHALESDHHLFISLTDATVVCLPENYEVADATLDDVKQNCLPTYADVPQPTIGRSIDGAQFTTGAIGLANLGQSDYLNSAVQLLARVPELKSAFLNRSFPVKSLSGSLSRLMKKLYNPLSFKATVSPQDLALTVQRLSEGKFSPKKQSDVQALLTWILNWLYKEAPPLAKLFRGKLQTPAKTVAFL